MSNSQETCNLISMDKIYKTRNGRNVRVLCTDNTEGGVWTVVALVDGTTSIYTSNGRCYNNEDTSGLDLIEVAQEHSMWIELYRSGEEIVSIAYESEEEMFKSIQSSKGFNSAYDYTLLATKKVVMVEGESCL